MKSFVLALLLTIQCSLLAQPVFNVKDYGGGGEWKSQ